MAIASRCEVWVHFSFVSGFPKQLQPAFPVKSKHTSSSPLVDCMAECVHEKSVVPQCCLSGMTITSFCEVGWGWWLQGFVSAWWWITVLSWGTGKDLSFPASQASVPAYPENHQDSLVLFSPKSSPYFCPAQHMFLPFLDCFKVIQDARWVNVNHTKRLWWQYCAQYLSIEKIFLGVLWF